MARRDSIGEVPPMPWRTVVGAGIAGEAKLDHLRLVSLGMRCWQDIEQYGLRIWFTDPDTGSILHLSRSWQRSEQENSPAATRRLFSFQAGALAGGQIVSQAAKRSADGELLFATRNRLSRRCSTVARRLANVERAVAPAGHCGFAGIFTPASPRLHTTTQPGR